MKNKLNHDFSRKKNMDLCKKGGILAASNISLAVPNVVFAT